MANTLPDGKWYDLGNLDQLHADLATDYSKTSRLVFDRPMLVKHFERCETCQRLKEDHQDEVEARIVTRPRRRYTITPADMAAILQLKPGEEIVWMYATEEPNTVKVVVAGVEDGKLGLADVIAIGGEEPPKAAAA